MKAGSPKLYIILFLLFFKTSNICAEEKINLNVLQPTFEEEAEIEEVVTDETFNIKSKKKQLKSNKESVVKLRALDKITAKTKDINIIVNNYNNKSITIGKKKKFGYLEILPKKCSKFEDQNNKGVAAYIQVRDLSDENGDKIFVFNGWTFSPNTTLKTFDHPIYDLWVTGCENI